MASWGAFPLPELTGYGSIAVTPRGPRFYQEWTATMKPAASYARSRWVLVAAALAAVTGVALTGPALASAARPAAGVALTDELTAGQVGSRASVPWRSVGPGWVLAVYSASSGGDGVPVKAGADTLYLVDPAGGRYTMATWPRHSAETSWSLQAWSGDSKRALFTAGGFGARPEQVHQLNLRTGKFASFLLPANVAVIGYTRPDGLNILATRGTPNSLRSKLRLLRYNLRGTLQRTLATVQDLGQVAYQPAGSELAAGSLRGLELISNAGGVIRALPVPGARNGCSPVRWWNTGTILASCVTRVHLTPRLWLVPARGSAPRALTPDRGGAGGFDFGDFNAWQLSSGLYVNGDGACGTVVIGKQPAHGKEIFVSVPGSASSLIVTATRSRLLVERINGCSPGVSLAWFNPASRAIKVAVPVHGHQFGVIAAVPYFVTGKY